MLSEEKRKAVAAEAARVGVSEADAIAAAEKISGDAQAADGEPAQAALVAERFLIGFLPYVTVNELRTKVLGLTEKVADDHLFTGEWLDIHGTQSATPAENQRANAMSDDDSDGRADAVTPTQKGEEISNG